MRKICAIEGMPGRTQLLVWLEENLAFRAKCARAWVLQAEYHRDRVQEVADESTPVTANADRVKISAYQWLAAKMNPKKYGEKIIDDNRTQIVNLNISKDEFEQISQRLLDDI